MILTYNLTLINLNDSLVNLEMLSHLKNTERLKLFKLFYVEEIQPAVNMSAKTRVYVMCDYSFICFNPIVLRICFGPI